MNRKKYTLLLVFLLLLVLIGLPSWRLYHEMRQARLDYALIEAIKIGDEKQILAALAEGADGGAQDTGKPPTFREALHHLLDHLRHSDQKDYGFHLSALPLLYQPRLIPGRRVINGQINLMLTDPKLTVVRALLDHGAQVNDQERNGKTALSWEVWFSNRDALNLLLARGANIEVKDRQGCTPLMDADADLTKILLEHGANSEAKDANGMTPLMYASSSGAKDIVRLLLEHGAKVSPQDRQGKTAFDFVRGRTDSASRQIAALLNRYGAK